jgi:6-phosphogluconolactonase
MPAIEAAGERYQAISWPDADGKYTKQPKGEMSGRCEWGGCNGWVVRGEKFCKKHIESDKEAKRSSVVDAIEIEKLELKEKQGEATNAEVMARQRKSVRRSMALAGVAVDEPNRNARPSVFSHQDTFDNACDVEQIDQDNSHAHFARPDFEHPEDEHAVKVHRLDLEKIPAALASYVAPLARDAIKFDGKFTVALSGGSMPKVLAAALPSLVTDWTKWHVFFADERCVELTHEDSNCKACRTFLSKTGIPESQIYKLDPALTPDEAAVAYTAHLHAVFGKETLPSFDLMLLGMGPDGHTASLFPHHPLLEEKEKLVAGITDSPKEPPARITLTLPVLNNSKEVCFIATGKSKADLIPEILKPHSTSELPCALVRPPAGALHWFIDGAAAALLPEEGDKVAPQGRQGRGISISV